MSWIDWTILVVSLLAIVFYGMYKGRRSKDMAGYFLADRGLKWPTILLSIMATQASAITFISTPGQAFVDGMRFVQFYFGLPLGMIILSITAVPIYHKLKVFTAYEFLEQRFDVKTRTLASILFLVQRGLAAGLTIFAPALIFSILLGWNISLTTFILGAVVVLYTSFGGTRAVATTHFHQMIVIMSGMVLTFFMIIYSLPQGVGLSDALHVAGKMGRMNVIDLKFDLYNKYNLWSGILGGMFLQLSYFGTDQSQVQRYLTGSSVTESRLGLLFNGIIKIPMQFFILLIGVLVFVFFQFEKPPVFFNRAEVEAVRQSDYSEEFEAVENEYAQAFENKKEAVSGLVTAMQSTDESAVQMAQETLQQRQFESDAIRKKAVDVLKKNHPQIDTSDTNYIFLSYATRYLPIGLIGLVMAAIIAASMSSTSGELNALASTTVVDIYKRLINREASDAKYVRVSKLATVGWGLYAVLLAEYASRLGSLIEAVNILGSLFYGTILGIFLVAFYIKKLAGTATFYGAILAEGLVVYCFVFTDLPFLWFNVIGCAGVIIFAGLISVISSKAA